MQKSREDYLRVIYSLYEKLKDKKEGVRSVDIASEFGISRASVSEMVRNLADEGLIRVKPYSKIFFTSIGIKEAKSVMHTHRLIEVFLSDVLKLPIKTPDQRRSIHDEAHRLEHAFSEESIKALDDFLKKPKVSPFGRPIPNGGKKK